MSIFGSNQPPEMVERIRKANENLQRIERGEYRTEASPKKRRELDDAEAWEIEMGDMVLEMRQLSKIELRYARREDKLTPEERLHWEEIDARLDTLREETKDYTKEELTRFVRLWNKASKKGSVNGPPRKKRRTPRR